MATRRAGKDPSQRQLRVGEELRHALAEVLHRADFRDPELQSLNVTVTEVRISPDLRNATAFVTPLGGGDAADAVRALRRAAPFFRAQLAKAVKLRHVPTIGFEADTSFDYAFHIDRLLHDPEVQRDLGHERFNGGDEDDEEEEDDEDQEEGRGDGGGRGA
jgi:ribosome-binding factor A